MRCLRIGRILSGGLGTIALAVALGCSPLPELKAGECGNFVIDTDKGEDCDTYANDGNKCAKPGEEHACHYVCPSIDVACPDGYGCSLDGVCRRSSGTFEFKDVLDGYAWPVALVAGEFDSDGRGDLLVLGEPDAAGYRSARALFSDGYSLQPGLGALPSKIANPAVGSGDGTSALNEIAFADFEGVALLRGYRDRTADFAVFPTVELAPKTQVRVVLTDVRPTLPDKELTHAGDEIVALMTAGDGSSVLKGIDAGGEQVWLADVPAGVESLAEDHGFELGKFDEISPCSQMIFAHEDAAAVDLYAPCANVSGSFSWNINGGFTTVKLEPPAKIDKGAMAADIDVDGDLDLVIGADDITYVAYGQGNGQFTSQEVNGVPNVAVPYSFTLVTGENHGFPLAVAELNGDGKVDFVMENGIFISAGSMYQVAHEKVGDPWSEALVGNLNANNLLDVVAVTGGELDIDFFNNAGNGFFARATLPTEGIPRHLRIGDFDGDLINDLVLSESILEHGEASDHLSFSFGDAFGAPSPPMATGEVGKLEQLVTGNLATHLGLDSMMEVGAVVEGEGDFPDGIALLPGRESRAIYSALPLVTGATRNIPVSLAFGDFGDSTSDVVALATDADSRLSLFRIEAFEDEGLGVPVASGLLPPIFAPSEVLGSVGPRHGAIVIAMDLDDDGEDEALVAALHADQTQGAFASARYDEQSHSFVLVEAVPLPGRVSIDSTMFAADLDGDSIEDMVLTTGTHDAPLPLVIRWGEGLGRVPSKGAEQTCPQLADFRATAIVALRSSEGIGKMLLASSPDGTQLIKFAPDRSCTFQKIAAIPSARAFAAVDFDLDGVEDIAAQTEDGLELFRSLPK